MNSCIIAGNEAPTGSVRTMLRLMSVSAVLVLAGAHVGAHAAADKETCSAIVRWTQQELNSNNMGQIKLGEGSFTDQKIQEVFGHPPQRWDEKTLKEVRDKVETCQKQSTDRTERGLYSRTHFLVNHVVSALKRQEQMEQAYQASISKIEGMTELTQANMSALAQYSKGYFDYSMNGLDENQRRDLQARAAAKHAEMQKPFFEARLSEIKSLPNEEASLKKLADACMGCMSVLGFGANAVDEEYAKQLAEAAKVKKAEIITVAGKPIIDRVSAIPETVDGIPAMNAILAELNRNGQYSEVKSAVSGWIVERRKGIVEAHQQKLCDAAIERLDTSDSVANRRVYAGMMVTLRDFVCEAEKRGVQVDYVEPGLLSFGGKPKFKIKLADPKVEIAGGLLKPGQVASIDVSEIDIPDSMFGPGGKALAGTYIDDGSGGRNLTTRDWERLVTAIMSARPPYLQT